MLAVYGSSFKQALLPVEGRARCFLISARPSGEEPQIAARQRYAVALVVASRRVRALSKSAASKRGRPGPP